MIEGSYDKPHNCYFIMAEDNGSGWCTIESDPGICYNNI